jgi:hypothetical protein
MFGRGKKPPEQGRTVQPADDEPPGEAEKVEHVKRLCWVAGMSAIYLNPESEDYQTLADSPEQQEYERNRYNEFRAKALRIADEITDEFYRSAAIHFIIEASMKAADEDDARALLNQVEVDFIREKIEAAYPKLKRQKLSSVVRQR